MLYNNISEKSVMVLRKICYGIRGKSVMVLRKICYGIRGKSVMVLRKICYGIPLANADYIGAGKGSKRIEKNLKRG